MAGPTTSERRDAPPTIEVRAAFAPATVNAEERTVDLTWTTGARVRRYDYRQGGWYMEQLRVDDGAIDLTRLNGGAPLLAQHNQYSLRGQIGVVERAWISGGVGHATVRFSRREEVEEIFQDVRDGIIRNVSVGYSQDRIADLDEEQDGVPVREVTRWTPHELSLVSIPADVGAQVREAPISCEETTHMENETEDTASASPETRNQPTPAPSPAPTVDLDAVRAAAAEQARAEERARVREINEAVDAAGLGRDFARGLVDEGVTADAARQRVLRALADQTPDTRQPTAQPGDGRREQNFRQAAVEGLAYRAGGTNEAPGDEAQRIAAGGIMHLARQLLEMGGRNTAGMAPAQLARAAMATGDFTHIIADTADRSLVRGYDAEVRTFAPVFRRTTVRNFQTIERIRLSDFPALTAVAEGAAYLESAFSENRETYTVAKYGRKAGYTWEMMVNEDLDALGRLPAMMGASAARLENDTVWGVLTANGNMADASPIFTGSNESNATLDAAGLAAARQYLREQTAENGQKLNLQAAFLVVGPELESDAENLLAVLPELSATSRGVIVSPSLRSQLQLVVEPRITGPNWYVMTAPTTIDTLEYAYLQGYERPTLTREVDFDIDQVSLKIRHVIGAGAIDRRGMFHSDSTV